jgi:hypothetical protein
LSGETACPYKIRLMPTNVVEHLVQELLETIRMLKVPLKKEHGGREAGRDCILIELVSFLGPIPSLQDPWRIQQELCPKPPEGVVGNC